MLIYLYEHLCSGKEYTRKTVPTILLSTVDQPLDAESCVTSPWGRNDCSTSEVAVVVSTSEDYRVWEIGWPVLLLLVSTQIILQY